MADWTIPQSIYIRRGNLDPYHFNIHYIPTSHQPRTITTAPAAAVPLPRSSHSPLQSQQLPSAYLPLPQPPLEANLTPLQQLLPRPLPPFRGKPTPHPISIIHCSHPSPFPISTTMCNWEDIIYPCGHEETRRMSYCHFARNDPWHNCFGVQVTKLTTYETILCNPCAAEEERVRLEQLRRNQQGQGGGS